ncbi:MAG: acyltransferase [Bacteroidetes bacterium]|nr:acyltransferase [Bacteroidota bacterium]
MSILRTIFRLKPEQNFVDGVFHQGKDCRIENSSIRIGKKGKLVLGDGVEIRNYKIHIEEGEMIVGAHTILEQANNALIPSLHIQKGLLRIGDHNVIRADFSIRFGGQCTIGRYNCINENTEIRCDEQLDIGDFNMISYECMIYDTNSHVIYSPEKRREMTIRDFPSIGREYEKPVSKPVSIGNDSWMGKRSVMLKGARLGNFATLGTNAVLTTAVPDNHMAYGNPAQVKPKQ